MLGYIYLPNIRYRDYGGLCRHQKHIGPYLENTFVIGYCKTLRNF